ncbi:allophanate hydrolase [Malaciobacter molluscorum LMG 25693]|uniref:Allophanate hydrolase n=1 Tax=Malaciobacter molluscorum LMG 25693 TaxID=870501 RepID=A0A2G1DIK7_9BACT|nr:5-oxoprolinase subunit PxpB [Malaciobacter molluscorum]AXX91929.1 allophanate hydrolase, subunit 1 [Malaciobacter molluscorum LMG 25693]PHO18332.1 allophanate hydrolase [Malaciobacter molluscorum LMG 25693]
MKIKASSADTLIIYFSNKIEEQTSLKVMRAYNNLLDLHLEGIFEIIPSYTSIYIHYDILFYDFLLLKQILEEKLDLNSALENNSKFINIDVYYGLDVGFDLEQISKKTAISIDEIIKIHSSKIYNVYAIGFLPGFAYLGNVSKKIDISRLDTPRKIVPKGSVAIANSQTAVYPQDSPGGWNIIGKTTYNFFNKDLKNLSNIKVGDKIKFNPISKDEFLKQKGVI